MDWSTRRVVDLMEVTLMSAGTLSPTEEKKKTELYASMYPEADGE